MHFGLENSLPLSVSITGNNLRKSCPPRRWYSSSYISITDFDVFASDHRIHLHHCCVRMLLHIHFIIMVISSHTASPVYFQLRLLVSRAIFYLSRQVYVTYIEQASVYVVVECLFAAHQFIFIVQVDLVD